MNHMYRMISYIDLSLKTISTKVRRLLPCHVSARAVRPFGCKVEFIIDQPCYEKGELNWST